MSNPVAATSESAKFGGLVGYKRPALGRPTSVPSGLPAFRGQTNQPTQPVKTPAIQTSKNQNYRPTNVTIPYARICPLDTLANVGRISTGDVVFTSRFRVNMSHVATQREQRIVGVDFLNKALGNDDRNRVPGSVIHHNWIVGQTVLLGGSNADTSDEMSDYDAIGSMVADNWRELSFLREWVCDGIVLSNDEPHAHTSGGERDVQMFNICVQGRCVANNGYQDFSSHGIESYHRSSTERGGYRDDGEPLRPHHFGTAIGGPFYQSFPLQMFDRKIKPLSNIFVGLVATKRTMNDQMRSALLKNSPNVILGSSDDIKLRSDSSTTFYTFKFVYFSDRAMWQSTESGEDVGRGAAEPSMKKQRNVHRDDARDGESFDQFEPVSAKDYRSMVGAWRIGKVLDTAARRRDQYLGGPIDTADQLTINLSLEWLDWRMLRRTTERGDIGSYVSGAPEWVANDPMAALDDERTLQWPTHYALATDKEVREASYPQLERDSQNAPLNMGKANDTELYPGGKDYQIESYRRLYRRVANAPETPPIDSGALAEDLVAPVAPAASRVSSSVRPMDTGEGVSLTFGIAAPAAAAAAPTPAKGKAPVKRKAATAAATPTPVAAPVVAPAAAPTVAPVAPAVAPAAAPVAASASASATPAAAPVAAPDTRTGRPSGAAARSQRPGTAGTDEMLLSIFGKTVGTTAAAAAAAAASGNDSDVSDAPSPAPASSGRSRVRRARDGR